MAPPGWAPRPKASKRGEGKGDNPPRRRVVRARRPPCPPAVGNDANFDSGPESVGIGADSGPPGPAEAEGEGGAIAGASKGSTYEEAVAAAEAVLEAESRAVWEAEHAARAKELDFSTANDSRCAACGEGGVALTAYSGCNLVKYCSNAECEERAAAIYQELLFREPEREDCPICFLPLPPGEQETAMYQCCGTVLCSGCMRFILDKPGANDLSAFVCPCCKPIPCPFCRDISCSKDDGSYIDKLKSRMDCGVGAAYLSMGATYYEGSHGHPKDEKRALALYLKAGDLGYATGYYNAGCAYLYGGEGVPVDKAKARRYMELAAIGGDANARCYVGQDDASRGSRGRAETALKHLLIAVRAGREESLDQVKQLYLEGNATKDDYGNALRAFQQSREEMKSEKREEFRRRREAK